uniref:Uncharacterized protein n=1 Tax=Escherichia coli TaxID=562 RepID=A0A3Q8VM51_ECOLX|nr:hypothetical protein [Escherichia coli]
MNGTGAVIRKTPGVWRYRQVGRRGCPAGSQGGLAGSR